MEECKSNVTCRKDSSRNYQIKSMLLSSEYNRGVNECRQRIQEASCNIEESTQICDTIRFLYYLRYYAVISDEEIEKIIHQPIE